jgi:hypothetical protein
MAAKFDNLDDVNSKFSGTICYYNGQAFVVKQAIHMPDGHAFGVMGSTQNKALQCAVDDPLFNYKNYNLGYANAYSIAQWWFRKPQRQYKQGLKETQMGRAASMICPDDQGWQFSKAFVAMLENRYPDLELVKKTLMTQEKKVLAFDKDFALSYDDVHDDYIIEYRGYKIGNSLNSKLTDFRLLDNHKHIQEALQEVLSRVHG